MSKPYPRILIVALGRINANDVFNNGMLLRSLFSGWPKANLAQIYSSGDNGDNGYCGLYYRLGRDDRHGGWLFYGVKGQAFSPETQHKGFMVPQQNSVGNIAANRGILREKLIDSGLYELVFRPKNSTSLRAWLSEVKPDIILAQGYNLTFSWLPVIIKRITGARMCFFSSDDWPSYLYNFGDKRISIISMIVRKAVERAVAVLMKHTDIAFAFGQAMAEEYEKRYQKHFLPLYHSDNAARFDAILPKRLYKKGVLSLVVAGSFNSQRWRLLLDLDSCCRQLSEAGIPARCAAIALYLDPAAKPAIAMAKYLDIMDDPGNESLPGYLKGADVLVLAEGFDDLYANSIRLSISSKAHLFMYAGKPTIVYAHPNTGVSRYAEQEGWAKVVGIRDTAALADAVKAIAWNSIEGINLVRIAREVAERNHSSAATVEFWRSSLVRAMRSISEE